MMGPRPDPDDVPRDGSRFNGNGSGELLVL